MFTKDRKQVLVTNRTARDSILFPQIVGEMSTSKYTNKLRDKRVLVIGGTSGIGFCIAENTLENGAIVTIASSRQSSVDDALSRLRASYPQLSSKVNGHVLDLKSSDAEANIKRVLDFATENGAHKLDHIAETAGDGLALKSLSDTTEEYVIDSQRVRWLGTIFLAKLAKDYLNWTSASSLTLTSGINSARPSAGWFLPAGVGSGKEGLARGLAVDLRPVRVNVVAPGAVFTELFTKNFDADKLQAVVDTYARETLVGEIGKPEDLCEAYVYCMRDRFVDGQAIYSEGGMLLAPGTRV